jgi:hypothetical protein
MRSRKNIPTQFRLDSDGSAEPNEIARFVDGQTIEGSGLTFIDGAIKEEVEFGDVRVRSAYFPLNDISSSSGVLTVNLDLGTVFRFTHNEDITLSFLNIPVDKVVFITIVRVQDNSSTSHDIDWDSSSGDFAFPASEKPILTAISGANDVLTLRTYNGGSNFVVNFVGNFA